MVKTKFRQYYRWIEIILIAIAGHAIISVALFVVRIFQDSTMSESQIRITTAKAAKNYCLTHKETVEVMDCQNLVLKELEGPLEYGPTDGGDEYSGSWFATFRSEKQPSSQIYVVANLKGKISYINTTGDREYPYCDLGEYERCSSLPTFAPR